MKIRVNAEYDVLFENPEEANVEVWFNDVFFAAKERGSITAYSLDDVEEKRFGIKCLLFTVDMNVPTVQHELTQAQIAVVVLNDVVSDSDVRVINYKTLAYS